MEMDADEMVEIGRVFSAHGVRGEMKVVPYTDFPEDRFMTPGVRYLRPPTVGRLRKGSQFLKVHLSKGRMSLSKGREIWLVTLKEVISREEADALSRYTMFVRSDERPELEDDEVYVKDLINMKVVMQETGKTIGRVVDVYEGTGQYNTLRVALITADDDTSGGEEDKGSFLIPFHEEMVPHIDIEGRVMTIDPPEGLLEATTTTPKDAKVAPRRPRQAPRKKIDGAEVAGPNTPWGAS